MKTRLVILFVLIAAGAAAFECEVVLTKQDASMDWWYAVPVGFEPEVTRVDRVNKGEYFRIIPFYEGCAVDGYSAARVSFDIEITRPDGSTAESVKGSDGLSGAVAPSGRIPSMAILNPCFSASDPYGAYAVNVTSVDHVAGITNTQSKTVHLVEFRMETLSEEERGRLFLTYPTAPEPAKALAAFLQTEHPFFMEDDEPVWSAIWFFKTVFENNEFLIPRLVEAFPRGTNKQRRDTILVMALMGRLDELPALSTHLKAFSKVMAAGRVPDPYGDIITGKQLDMLWAEFFATGTVKPLRRVVESLRLVEHVGALEKIKSGELDPKNPEVYRAGLQEAVFQSALVSLRSNCQTSPLTRQYCVGVLQSDSLDARAASCLAMLLKSIENKEKDDEK